MGKPKFDYTDAVGKKINKWTILEEVPREKGKKKEFICRCDCGTVAKKKSYEVYSGHTTNCGCVRREKNVKRNKSKKQKEAVKKAWVERRGGEEKNLKDNPEYSSWAHMKYRCYNKNCKQYKDYGGRGIKVCDRWLDSFQNFFKDMGRRPEGNYSLERVDNNKGYSPDNCVWADRITQRNNQRKRKNSTTGIEGVYGNEYGTFVARYRQKHLGSFKTIDEAIEAREKAIKRRWETSQTGQ